MKTEQELRSWLGQKIAGILNTGGGEIDGDIRFKDYGLDSKLATMLTNQLSAWLGKEPNPTLFWDHPTLNELVVHLLDTGEKPVKPLAAGQAVDPSEPIAIIGLSCRLPNAADKDAYWEMLKKGVSGIRRVPEDRWRVEDYFDEDLGRKGKMNTVWGGFLDQVDRFDAGFFGISPREANQMDPQQRLMMELSWEALEDGGIDPKGLKGSRTGVFYSAIWNDYLILSSRMGAEHILQHSATGMHHSIIANRVSYFLGLQGPSMAVDTACSSSLVSVHLAVQSLRRGECTLAMAGGVNLMLAPESTVSMSKFGAMAPDGQSKAFDARANGYVRGEGGGVVLLKPLSQALIDGDRVYALVLESAINNDGFSNGLTAPNPKAQEALLDEVYHRAGIDPRNVQFIETHGTGTLLGDPIEAKALGNVLGRERPEDRPLLLGSVKTNIGHLEGAAGIAGLIKAVLAVKHRQIPPNLNFQAPNPNIPFAEMRLKVPEVLMAWPDEAKPALAGVSSFGFGGTNCHVVIGELKRSGQQVLPLSAGSRHELRRKARLAAETLKHGAGSVLSPVRVSIQGQAGGGDPDKYRVAFVGSSREQLAGQLAAFAGEPCGGCALAGVKKSGEAMGGCGCKAGGSGAGQQAAPESKVQAPVVFVCSGQGSQYRNMARTLILEEPVFRARMEDCDRVFRTQANWSVLGALLGGEQALSGTGLIQPALFAIQVSLAALWSSWGIKPDVVIGHSMGEVAAAHIAGILSLPDAARIIYERSRLLGTIAGRGSMALVELSGDALVAALEPYGGLLSPAAYNSPVSTVVAGDTKAMGSLLQELTAAAIYNKQINVDVASHSSQVDDIREELLDLIRDIRPVQGELPMISTVSGTVLPFEKFDKQYWGDNLRMPVRFSEAIASLAGGREHVFIELSPHPILVRSIGEICTCPAFGSMERDEDQLKAMYTTLAKLYKAGYPVDWERVSGCIGKGYIGNAGVEEGLQDWRVLPLSAHSDEALREMAERYKEKELVIVEAGGGDLAGLVYTAAVKRTHLRHRLAVAGRGAAGLAEALGRWLAGRPEAVQGGAGEREAGKGKGRSVGQLKLAFVFSGQGGQWVGMGRELYWREPVFRAAIRECDGLLQELSGGGWSLAGKLLEDHDHFSKSETAYIQPMIFSVQLGLARLWESWGIRPQAVIGHSMGEIAAACVAGAISVRDAVRIIYYRGQVMQKSSGAMLLLHLPAERVQVCIEESGMQDHIFISAVNSETDTLVSGKSAAMAQFREYLSYEAIACKEFSNSYAFHCPVMEPFGQELYDQIEDVRAGATRMPLFSTVSGEQVEGAVLNAEYWIRNMVCPVRFAKAMRRVIEGGYQVVVEIGPTQSLASAILNNMASMDRETLVFPSMRKHTEGHASMYTTLASLYGLGFDVDWRALHTAGGRQVDLPVYAFQRKRYWLGEGQSEREVQAEQGMAGEPVANLKQGVHYRLEWRPADIPVLPGAAGGALRRIQVVFADRAGYAEGLLEMLERSGQPFVRVLAGSVFEKYGEDSYLIDPGRKEDYLRLFGEIGGERIAAVTHCWSWDLACGEEGLTPELMTGANELITKSLLYIIQSVGQAGPAGMVLNLVAGRGSSMNNRSDIALLLAPARGLCRTLSLESPGMRGRVIGIDGAGADMELLYRELVSPDREDAVEYRRGKRMVERLIGHEDSGGGGDLVQCDESKAYLITGGTGGLGLRLAERLVAGGAKHLVLTGRSGVPADQGIYDRLLSLGVDVRIVRADVAVYGEIEGVIGGLTYPLGGIIHAAGVARPCALAEQDWSGFAEVLAPKAAGAWNLHCLTREMEIDFFVCISSVSALLGAARLGSYGAANAFLDGMATYRKRLGLPCATLDLGPVADTGLVARHKAQFDKKALGRAGIRLLDMERTLRSFACLVNENITQLVVLDGDMERMSEVFGGHHGLLDVLRPGRGGEEDGRERFGTGGMEPAAIVSAQVRGLVEKVLETSFQDMDKDVFESGLDSLMVIELVKLIQEKFRIKLSPVTIYAHPTVDRLAGEVYRMMRPDQAVPTLV